MSSNYEDDIMLNLRAVRLNREIDNKYSVPYIEKFIREWEEITSILKARCEKEREGSV